MILYLHFKICNNANQHSNIQNMNQIPIRSLARVFSKLMEEADLACYHDHLMDGGEFSGGMDYLNYNEAIMTFLKIGEKYNITKAQIREAAYNMAVKDKGHKFNIYIDLVHTLDRYKPDDE